MTFNVTGELSLSRPDPAGCEMDDTVKDKIVVVTEKSCSSASKIDACQRVGCLGVIEHTNNYQVAGYRMWSWIDSSFSRSHHAPCVEISPNNGDFVRQLMATPNSLVIGILSSEDPNPYGEFFSSLAFTWLRIVMISLIIVPFSVALHRIVIWWRSSQKLVGVAWTILIVELLANLERGIYAGMRFIVIYCNE